MAKIINGLISGAVGPLTIRFGYNLATFAYIMPPAILQLCCIKKQ